MAWRRAAPPLQTRSGEFYSTPADGAKPTYDPASISEPLELTGPQGDLKPVLLCGVIDRVDFDAGGVKAVIMDYKLGRPPDFAAIASGSSLQMPLYLLAMERLFGKIGAAACYDSALETGRRRIYRTEHVNMKQFAPLLPHDSSEHVKPQTRQQFSEIAQAAEGGGDWRGPLYRSGPHRSATRRPLRRLRLQRRLPNQPRQRTRWRGAIRLTRPSSTRPDPAQAGAFRVRYRRVGELHFPST